MKRLALSLVATLLMAMMMASNAQATITSTTGGIVKIPPPPSTLFGDLESDDTIWAFDEQQNVTLDRDVAIDISQPGEYDDNDDLTPGTIPAGTKVSSHMVHGDNVGSGSGAHHISGTVTTDRPIIGINIMNPNLANSDFLGAPGTVYPLAPQRRFNLETTDMLVWQLDNHTVYIFMRLIAHVDQIRIITEGEPEERIGGEGCTPGYWKQEQHFDSWVGLSPTDSFEATFGRDAFSGSPTLLDALEFKGGGLNQLSRQATAALLNALHPDVDYAYTSSQVISMWQAAFDSGTFEPTKDLFDEANNGGCELN